MDDNHVFGVYIRVDEQCRITEINSEGLLENLDGLIRVGEYESDEPYAQGNYFPGPIIDDRGVWRYCYAPDSEQKWRERTREEMDADAAAMAPPMSDTDAALVELAAMISEQMVGIAELGAVTAELTAGVAELAALIGGGE